MPLDCELQRRSWTRLSLARATRIAASASSARRNSFLDRYKYFDYLASDLDSSQHRLQSRSMIALHYLCAFSRASTSHAKHLTMRWSERRTAVRSIFEMTSTLPPRSTRALVRRRSPCSR